jgi:hypothetical protein
MLLPAFMKKLSDKNIGFSVLRLFLAAQNAEHRNVDIRIRHGLQNGDITNCPCPN